MDTRTRELVERIEAGKARTWPGRKTWSVRNELAQAVATDDASRERIARAIVRLDAATHERRAA